jgi:hypothetical protein
MVHQVALTSGSAGCDRNQTTQINDQERGRFTMEYQYVGVVTHYFDRIGVAVILLDQELYLEDWILIQGPRTSVEQQVHSMQINHQTIDKGQPGEEIALKTDSTVREGDEVFLIVQ